LHFRPPIAALLALLMALAAVPVQAGQAELDLLSSYIGNWSGAGVLKGGDKPPEPFRCRLTISKGTAVKINYSGRCTLANMNLSVAGTIAFDDATETYQAAMSSNAGFTGRAIGRQHGGDIDFDLKKQQADRSGKDVRIGSRIHLVGAAITVDFEVEFNNSGQILTATVPFQRRDAD
jgi:hypothetical protein